MKENSRQIGRLPIFISILCLLNGVFATIRVDALFTSFFQDVHFDYFAVAFSLEYATLFGALWLFAMKFYEAAENIKDVLTKEEPDSSVTKAKKRKFAIFRWIIFGFICLPLFADDIFVAVYSSSIDIKTTELLILVDFVVLTVSSFTTMILLAAVLIKLYVLIAQMELTKNSISRTFITL